MSGARYWSVDQLAANRLAAELKLDATEDTIDRIAAHFADHRRDMMDWAAERIHGNAIRALESASTSNFGRHGDDWNMGFRRAEEQLLTMSPSELLSLEPDQTRSQGQILRSMVRQARRS